jgi:hypothetical protein
MGSLRRRAVDFRRKVKICAPRYFTFSKASAIDTTSADSPNAAVMSTIVKRWISAEGRFDRWNAEG